VDDLFSVQPVIVRGKGDRSSFDNFVIVVFLFALIAETVFIINIDDLDMSFVFRHQRA